jgi:hypothetical protein
MPIKVARKRYTFNILQNAYYPKPNYYLYFHIKLVVYFVSYLIGEGIYEAFNVWGLFRNIFSSQSGSLPTVPQFHNGRFCIKPYRDTVYSKDKTLDMSPLPFLRKKKHAHNKYNETT